MAAPPQSNQYFRKNTSKPSDWNYVSEGKMNAVFAFSYDPSSKAVIEEEETTSASFYHGRILRLSKEFLREAAASSKQDRKELGASKQKKRNVEPSASLEQKCNDIAFASNVVRPKLGEQYVDVPLILELSGSFVAQLYHLALEGGNIPQSRLEQEWKLPDSSEVNGENNEEERYYHATLQRNYTALLPSDLPSQWRHCPVANDTSLCIEVKSKAGYLSYSPLVKKDHRAKFHYSRYSIMQQLIASDHLVKGWFDQPSQDDESATTASGTPQISLYSPLDLFSQDIDRVTTALKCVFCNPQNNVRLWYQGQLILGYKTLPTHDQCEELLTSLFPSSSVEAVTTPDARRELLVDQIIHLVAQIFMQESSLFSNLLSLQRDYDFVDVDGIIEIYKRLVELCDGSNVDAEAYLDDVDTSDGLSCFPFEKPTCPAFSSLIQEVKDFEAALPNIESNSDVSEVEAFMDKAHSSAMKLVRNLSKSACIWFLQRWLLSLTVCDVSLMMSFHALHGENKTDVNSCTSSQQSVDKAGILVDGNTQNDDQDSTTIASNAFAYLIKAVDYDPKPSKKLRKKEKNEDDIKHFKPPK